MISIIVIFVVRFSELKIPFISITLKNMIFTKIFHVQPSAAQLFTVKENPWMNIPGLIIEMKIFLIAENVA